MGAQTIMLEGAEYVILPRAEYLKLVKKNPKARREVDAVEFGRASIGADLRRARETAGLTQEELARRLKKESTDGERRRERTREGR